MWRGGFLSDHFASQFVQSEYTTGSIISETPLHKPIIRSHLSNNLNLVFADLVDEIEQAFDSVLDLPDNNGMLTCFIYVFVHQY